MGVEVERLLEFRDRLRLGGGVLVERLAEVAVLPERLIVHRRRGGEEKGRRQEREEPAHRGTAPLPSRTLLIRSTGTETFSTRPLGQRISRLSIFVALPNPKWSRLLLCPA